MDMLQKRSTEKNMDLVDTSIPSSGNNNNETEITEKTGVVLHNEKSALLRSDPENPAPISTSQSESIISHSEKDEGNVAFPKSPHNKMEISDSKSEAIENNDSSSPVTRKTRSRLILDDSDSDNEFESNNESPSIDSVPNRTEEESTTTKKNHKRRRNAVFDSDSDSENVEPITPYNNSFDTKTKVQLEDFGTLTAHNKSFDNKNTVDEDISNDAAPIYMMDSKNQIVPEGNEKAQKSRLAMLCDSDSDEESIPERPIDLPNDVSNDEIIEQTQHQEQIKLKSRSKAASKNKVKNLKQKAEDLPKKMTPKEAAEQRKEIQSESQRMLREKNVSLPYHKPKCHSLKEFLSRRPKLSSALPANSRAPPSVAIKMSSEQLEVISKKLKEREREVKKFYKSESESDNEDNGNDNAVTLVAVNSGSNVELREEAKGDPQQGVSETAAARNTPDVMDVENNSDNVEITNKNSDSGSTESKGVHLSENAASGSTSNCDIMDHASDSEGRKKDLTKENEVISNLEGNNVSNKPYSESAMDIDETPQTINPTENSLPMENPINTSPLNPGISDHLTSESYDFQLEDENTEQLDKSGDPVGEGNPPEGSLLNRSDNAIMEQAETTNKSNPPTFTYTDLDREIENYGNSHEDTDNENQRNKASPPSIKSKLELLKERLANDKPKLSGGPDDVIDLDSGVSKAREVVQLMERFAKHVSAKKHQPKHKVKLSIVTVESGGDIHKEEVAMNVDSDEESTGLEEKPGAKLQKLKEELQKQMEQRKSELWQQKAARGIRGGQEVSEDQEDGEKDILDYDDEEEAEMTDEEETDEEEIEDDVELEDKPKKKSELLNDEAEVSDDEELGSSQKEGYEDAAPENDEDEIEGNDDEVEDDEGNDGDEDQDSNISCNSLSSEQAPDGSEGKKKVLKRILKPADDSDEEDLFNVSSLQKSTTNAHLDSTITADEDDIPPHQPRPLHTPIRPAVSQTKSISDFLTPISFITSIQNLTSASKSIKDGSAESPFRMPGDIQSPHKDTNPIPPTKLFTDSGMLESQISIGCMSQTQESSSDLGKFSQAVPEQETQSQSIEEPPSTQDLLGICSGEFTGVTQSEPSEETKQLICDSQTSEVKSLGQEDMIISQLLDEEELENFKKKFESSEKSVSQSSLLSEAKEITGGGVIDSDDEEDTQQKKKKKKQKRIQFSDDEDSDEEDNEDQEVIDLQDRDNEEDDDIDNVDYDSEENEIDLKEGGNREKLKLTDFLEKEAELSESEWGSEDEDEKDLDQLEFELGDTEKFDEEKMKSDLEKIHMRRMLDDDTREVKLLQELLLEDGEMHGTGRQRQFKWKNIDSNTDDGGEEKKDDDDIYLDEEESEEQWRKKRHEREMFLKQQQQKSQNLDSGEDLLCTSQLLKIGQKFLQRSMSNNSQNSASTEKNNIRPESPFKSSVFSLQSKRGSFLNRSDHVLQRVAEYTKVTETIDANSRKTTKHFLFQSVSSAEVAMGLTENKKRKATEGTPNVIKKLRLNTNLSPAVKKKTEKSDRAKKLFNF